MRPSHHLVLLCVASMVAGAGLLRIGETMIGRAEEYMSRLNECLPEDRCTLHIEPKDQPWLNLTCDLNRNTCWDDPPLPAKSCVFTTDGPNSGGLTCRVEDK